jgi:hypothetical protein
MAARAGLQVVLILPVGGSGDNGLSIVICRNFCLNLCSVFFNMGCYNFILSTWGKDSRNTIYSSNHLLI